MSFPVVFFFSLKSVGYLVNEVESNGIKTVPSVTKIFCSLITGSTTIQNILPCFFQGVVKTHLNKLTWNQELSHSMALERKKAQAEGLSHHPDEASVPGLSAIYLLLLLLGDSTGTILL